MAAGHERERGNPHTWDSASIPLTTLSIYATVIRTDNNILCGDNWTMKTTIIILCFLCLFSGSAISAELVTQHYRLNVVVNCGEGQITCDDIDLTAINRQSQKIIFQTKGHTRHVMCADGITPCRFLGYECKIKNMTFFLAEDGTLTITADKSDIVINEKGEWQAK